MERQQFTIGRAGEIKLYDDTVSRRHAVFEIEDGLMFLRDLDSRNGTYEIVDKKLVPFASGAIYPDQVFAFGECVRSVTQLLAMARDLGADIGQLAELDPESDQPLDATQVGISVAAQPRLTTDDIIELLDKVDEEVEAGGGIDDVCTRLGITLQRYERWRAEHGRNRAEREGSMDFLRRENERLRGLVADLSLECRMLKDELAAYRGSAPPAEDKLAGEDTSPPGVSASIDG